MFPIRMTPWDLNCLAILASVSIVSLLLIIEYILTTATPNYSLFHVKFLMQLIMNLYELFLGPKKIMTQFSQFPLSHWWSIPRENNQIGFTCVFPISKMMCMVYNNSNLMQIGQPTELVSVTIKIPIKEFHKLDPRDIIEITFLIPFLPFPSFII